MSQDRLRSAEGTENPQVWQGGCHCKAVRFDVAARLRGQGELVDILDCNCSICNMKGYLHLQVEKKDFNLLQGKDRLSTYTFGTHTAEHWFCSVCGVQSFYKPRSHPQGISVNVRCLDEYCSGGQLDPSTLPIVKHDGTNWEQSLDTLKPLPS
mmetsp:Transcript_17290/g.67258  ORF Transcript_17290/g.67258 Transcript_17290/m.67258 type:complete len:153 (+) Transcript_17290:39-497(+)